MACLLLSAFADLGPILQSRGPVTIPCQVSVRPCAGGAGSARPTRRRRVASTELRRPARRWSPQAVDLTKPIVSSSDMRSGAHAFSQEQEAGKKGEHGEKPGGQRAARGNRRRGHDVDLVVHHGVDRALVKERGGCGRGYL